MYPPTQKVKKLTLGQGQYGIAEVGDCVFNGYTTSCGLVLAFNASNTKVACYHWPFMNVENETYIRDFTTNLEKMGAPVSKVIIITNYPVESQLESYINSARCIREIVGGVETHYFVHEKDNDQTPLVTLTAGNIESFNPVEELPLG